MSNAKIYATIEFSLAEKDLFRLSISEYLGRVADQLETKLTQSKSKAEIDFYNKSVPNSKAFATAMESKLASKKTNLTEKELQTLRSVISPYPNGELVHDSALGKLDRPLQNDTSQDGDSIFENE